MKHQAILITGATGKTGSRVAEGLTQVGIDVRKGSRSAVIPFDWENESTWSPALNGMDAVYITFQPDLAVPGAKEKIEVFSTKTKEEGLKKIVLLSGKGEHEAELCEDIVKASGVDWTIVRASWFNQNFSEGFFVDPIRFNQVALPKTDALVPYVDADDIAAVVVKTLTEEGHNSQTYELTGPDQLTFEQAIKVVSKELGREIQFESISMDKYKEILKSVGLPPDYIWLIEYLFTEVLTVENSIVTHDIEKVLGRKPITFKGYVKRTAATGVWNPEG